MIRMARCSFLMDQRGMSAVKVYQRDRCTDTGDI